MLDLLAPIYEIIKPLIDVLIGSLPVVLIAAALIAVFGRIGLAGLIKLGQRWAGYEEGHRSWNPANWFKLEPKKHFEVKGKILANEAIRELYAPASHYTKDLGEKEKAWKLAFLSPFPRAVKASIKASNTPKGKKLDARRQIAAAARAIEVCSLPEGVYVSGDLSKHYQIKLATVGKDPATIEKVENNLLTQLALSGGIQKIESGDPTTLSYVAHEEPVIDPLTEKKIGVEWLDEHPAKSPYSLPLAIKQDGGVLYYNLHHGICGGASGTGKGSFIQAMIYQLAPFVKKGTVELWGIDPKWSELKLYHRNPSKLFKRISVGMDEEAMRSHAETIADLKELIARRIAQDTTSIEEGKVEDGRDFTATKENPIVILFIDEYPTLYNGFNLLGKDGKKPQAELDQIVATGRSLGIFVEAATQKFDKALLEAIRDNIANWWLLGQPSPYFNDLFLGENAKAEGYDSTAIPRSGKANGYKTAGVGFAKGEDGKPAKFRLPFISKDDMAALIRGFLTDEDRAVSAEIFVDYTDEDDDGDFSIVDEGETLPELESFEMDDFDDFEQPMR
ncbi:MAG: FtsK/SpoIIIE domain-containing protein [Microbacterium gubbeenense]|uniref:FtsK/SpoIIIE domain-containing protein n=1 Tax=Microbacterium gubbeenense TaxID=159896 RepID=UPI003F9B3EB6